jgi:hypothetical protein
MSTEHRKTVVYCMPSWRFDGEGARSLFFLLLFLVGGIGKTHKNEVVVVDVATIEQKLSSRNFIRRSYLINSFYFLSST